jgi:hypothetical protein
VSTIALCILQMDGCTQRETHAKYTSVPRLPFEARAVPRLQVSRGLHVEPSWWKVPFARPGLRHPASLWLLPFPRARRCISADQSRN